MTRTRDPFPTQGRLRQRYSPPTLDPVEIMLAQAEAREAERRQRVAQGKTEANPTDLRGIPCIARGVGGTSPGSDPLRETERRLENTRRPTLAA